MAALEVLTMVATQPNRLSTGHGPALGKPKQEELLGKLGASFKIIESVLGTLSGIRIAQAVKAKTNEKWGK